MTARKPRTRAEAVEQHQATLAELRLNDPDEHFPYKHAAVRALVRENPPMGPDGPEDDRVRAEDYTSDAIADCSRKYIEAQAAYLKNPGDATKGDYDHATDRLVEARQAHRASRPAGGNVVGIRARRAGE